MSLEFTPLEFETTISACPNKYDARLEFTPLEFETKELAKNG